jgi:multidrug efflux pump subunit AcrA (membrane-fusion protein)
MCEQAQLTVERMEIRSPAAGIVMARLVEPGSRISMSSKPGDTAAPMAGAVVRLYDPAKLQVRVDVPLADVAKIGVGTRAEISTEALPEKTFTGTVTRVVHEANIQRNTVQVKVAIQDPVPTLKPEMLTRVRFYAPSGPAADATAEPGHVAPQEGGMRLFVPAAALLGTSSDKAQVWLVDQSSARGPTVLRKEITIATGPRSEPGAYVEVTGGLNAGDRLVIEAPPALKSRSRVRILGEHAGPPSPEGSH